MPGFYVVKSCLGKLTKRKGCNTFIKKKKANQPQTTSSPPEAVDVFDLQIAEGWSRIGKLLYGSFCGLLREQILLSTAGTGHGDHLACAVTHVVLSYMLP